MPTVVRTMEVLASQVNKLQHKAVEQYLKKELQSKLSKVEKLNKEFPVLQTSVSQLKVVTE